MNYRSYLKTKFNKNITFGVELEMGSRYTGSNFEDKLSRELPRLQFTNGGYHSHREYNRWNVSRDSSLNTQDSHSGVELVSPVLEGDNGLSELESIMDCLLRYQKAGNTSLNSSCSVHVHMGKLGFEDRDFKRFIYLFQNNQKFINAMLVKSRRNGRWCKDVKAENFINGIGRNARVYNQSDRYTAINREHWGSRKTLEFRSHYATFNYSKIVTWIILLQKMVAYANGIERELTFTDATSFLKAMRVGRRIRRNITKQIIRLNGDMGKNDLDVLLGNYKDVVPDESKSIVDSDDSEKSLYSFKEPKIINLHDVIDIGIV